MKTETNNLLVTFWVSADGQSSINMTGATAPEALRDLLNQCANDDQRSGILAGHFMVQGRPNLPALMINIEEIL